MSKQSNMQYMGIREDMSEQEIQQHMDIEMTNMIKQYTIHWMKAILKYVKTQKIDTTDAEVKEIIFINTFNNMLKNIQAPIPKSFDKLYDDGLWEIYCKTHNLIVQKNSKAYYKVREICYAEMIEVMKAQMKEESIRNMFNKIYDENYDTIWNDV